MIIAQKKLFAQNFFTRYDGRPINQLEYRMDDGFHLKIDRSDSIMVNVVNAYDEDEKSVWLAVYVSRASAATVLTKEQAKELIAALQQVIA